MFLSAELTCCTGLCLRLTAPVWACRNSSHPCFSTRTKLHHETEKMSKADFIRRDNFAATASFATAHARNSHHSTSARVGCCRCHGEAAPAKGFRFDQIPRRACERMSVLRLAPYPTLCAGQECVQVTYTLRGGLSAGRTASELRSGPIYAIYCTLVWFRNTLSAHTKVVLLNLL